MAMWTNPDVCPHSYLVLHGMKSGNVAMDNGKRNQGDGEDLGRHQASGKGPADVEGAHCCPTCHFDVKCMSE